MGRLVRGLWAHLYCPEPNAGRITALKLKTTNPEENMGRPAVLVLLVAISAVVSGSAQQKNAHTTSPGDISSGGGQLGGTWRVLFRGVRVGGGAAGQDP